ncbi:hypothetical protein FRB96_000244 [Tulasnella sp. 330]|nr:hypothetical protein FRB96_000244 [Tulasnella sp. 330]KAG8886516.1 hypothetical protein FRB97_003027 [Tulasnella sp. 331]KAG8889774.1 hypothetical protein FRB98_002696 [Tulasnella sp. 332]
MSASTTPQPRDVVVDAKQLASSQLDLTGKIAILTATRDAMDTYSASDMVPFVATLLPVMVQVLKTGQPTFDRDAPEQQLRHLLLEIMHRMPVNEHVRPHAPEITTMMTQILRTDNEENAVSAIKVVLYMYRGHRTVLEAPVQGFMDAVLDIYKSAPDMVRELVEGTSEPSPGSGSSPPKAGDYIQPLVPGMRSFRVLGDIPLATAAFASASEPLIGALIQFTSLEAEGQKRAHDEATAQGDYQIGMSANVQNKTAYVAFLAAQVKAMCLLAYMMRMPEAIVIIRQYQDIIPGLVVRLLQDIPLEIHGLRKEMVLGLRHVANSEFRALFLPFVDLLLDERLLVGIGMTGTEQLRSLQVSVLADLVHFLRPDLSSPQLIRVVHMYAGYLHDPSLSPGLQNLCTKALVGLQDVALKKLGPEEGGRMLGNLLESYVSKLFAVRTVFQDLLAMLKATLKEKERREQPEFVPDPLEGTPYTMPEVGAIEKLKPVQRAAFAVEPSEEVMKECRAIFRTLLHGIRGTIVALRSIEGHVPSSEVMGRFFEGAFRCLALWPGAMDPRDEKDVIEHFTSVFHEFQPHVFQEVWTLKTDFFISIAHEHPFAIQITNALMGHTELSKQLTSMMLKHLVDRLDLLGDQDARSANITLRLFKMVFMSVNLQPETNEPILAPHLTRLMMDSFPLAAKARDPTSYYLLIRALFRSISGGRFERMYHEILPLLQELLENLNRLIGSAEGATRDLLVELCLTVPVRLTHLLPYLQHLMRPLVLALRGSSEMAAQGLRTLELCIDNLTQDFLEPCFAPVRQDLMGALHDLLRPLPFNHMLAHNCIRILGKLGGRNRRLQYEYPELDYHPCAEEASILLSFDGRDQRINLGPMAHLAAKSVRHPNATYRKAAFDVLGHTISAFLQDGVQGRERESIFTAAIEGVFTSVHVSDLKEKAIQYVRGLSRHIFVAEVLNREPGPPSSRRYPMSPIATIFVDWLPRSLAYPDREEVKTAEMVVRLIVEDLAGLGKEDVPMDEENAPRDPSGILHNLASAFVAMSHDATWTNKMAGSKGIMIMASTEALPPKMTLDREFDFVRALISVLKDMPVDPPRDVDEVIHTLMDVIKKSDTTPPGPTGGNPHLERMPYLLGILHMELASSNAIVRSATQESIQLLSSLTGKSPTDLLLPHRERLLMPIYTKPLRALSFSTQIGHIDAVTYCLGLEPPLPEANEELLRLLSEALALADADDQNLLGRTIHRQNSLALTRLRVACIKLLTASMPVTDFFQRQPPVRARATSVYFKSLYSTSLDVKNAAHDGLRVVLQHQARLPRELLQTGLRPILMNLADPKRISVSGLDGLSRLLELLTNYFKVEIGVKLLEHYRSIAEAGMLHEAAFSPLASNEEVSKLVKLVNIFHLLPPAANTYLEDLSNLVVETETQLQAAAPTPFTEPFGKYIDRFPVQAVEYFLRRLQSARHVRTLRNVLARGIAPHLRDELMAKIPQLIQVNLNDVSHPVSAAILDICEDLVQAVPSWLESHPEVLQALLEVWKRELTRSSSLNTELRDATHVPNILLSIFMSYLGHSMQPDVLFEVVAIYTAKLAMDTTDLTQFLYQHVVAIDSVALKHEVLTRFMDWLDRPAVSWAHKTKLLAVVINPLLLAALVRKDLNEGLIDADILGKVHSRIWSLMANSTTNAFPGADDEWTIQVLQLSCTLIQLDKAVVSNFRKDIVRCAINLASADDMYVRQMAHLLAARFFSAYDAPAKFLLNVWKALLKPSKETEKNVEDRRLTRIALDILAPILSEKLEAETWIKQTRLLVRDEGHTVSALVIFYQVVVAHPDVFFECRDFLIPQMASSLSKVGSTTTATNGTDTRVLCLDLIDLILTWERRQRESSQDNMDISPSDSSGQYTTPLALRENIVSWVLRFTTTQQPDQSIIKGALASRALQILDLLLGPKGWPEVTVKIAFFGKVFTQMGLDEVGSPLLHNNAKAMAIVLKDKDDAYFTSNLAMILGILERPMLSNDAVLHEILQPILSQLLAATPPVAEDAGQDSPARNLYSWVDNAINEGLKNQTNLSGTLAILQSLVLVQPKKVEVFAASLMKALLKLVKDYTSTPQVQNYETMVPLIQAVLEICRAHVGLLGENRQLLLKVMVQLIDKSQSAPLCRYLLDVVREWTLGKKESIYPTLKEKASLMLRMQSWFKDEALWSDVLKLVLDIYTEPALRRSDVTVRLETLYLFGCRAKDPVLRNQFVELYNESLPRGLSSRMQYVLGSNTWESLHDQYWIPQALDLILGSINGNLKLLPMFDLTQQPLTGFSQAIKDAKVDDLLHPTRVLLHLNSQATHHLWVSVFKGVWATFTRKEQQDVTRSMVALLSKDYHIRQIDTRINIIQSFLTAISACSPPMSLPPYLVKYLGKTYNAWHVALEMLQGNLESIREDDASRDATYDALAELYSELSEDDMFYGLWRRRSMFNDTNVGISFEQCGMYAVAQTQYELAQMKVRSGTMAFNESEHCLWEDHWILTAQKLQQWDILMDLARAEENADLLLECAWRTSDWNVDRDLIERALLSVAEIPTPRRRVFESYTTLVRSHANGVAEKADFLRLCDEAMQLALRKWISLPGVVSMAHVPILQLFQQFVELHEASAIFTALENTNAQNLEKKSSELKGVLQAWRERLPNLWDDISIWSDLVAWRQHVFTAINNTYLPLIPQIQVPANGNGQGASNTTFGYRGYHETAWIINRFAHTARKHHLPDVCHTSLAKIYTLPNIEISEAFLKLREQARCHYQNSNELHAGLEVINNTNLMYFSNSQKAEFHTLKGMFIAKLGLSEEANSAFGLAVQTDLGLAKAWAEWGRFNDKNFRDSPTEMGVAGNAVSCYMQAAGLYKSAKTRPLLIRIMWLLANDDSNGTVLRAFDAYSGDLALWYWITLIPQLLQTLTYRETPYARHMLINLAKNFPQALFFHLRTLREDLLPQRKKHMQAMAAAQAEQAKANANTAPGENATSPLQTSPATPLAPRGPRQPWETVEEIVAILKTAFPLLALTLETMVDQFAARFKATQEEELVRYFNALLMEALNQHSVRVTQQNDDGSLPEQCIANANRFAESALHPETRAMFKADVLDTKPNLRQYLEKLQVWRDKYEKVLEARPRLQPLDVLSHWLVEFQHSKFDEVEVPGQYLQHNDTSANFVRIARFNSQYELCVGMGFSYRRITILGHDATTHSFIVQLPTSRNCRREEKLHQMFRVFNSVLARRKETRKRVLQFYLPAAVPLNPTLRLLENDSSIVGLQDIYDNHLRELGVSKEAPIILHTDKFRTLLDLHNKGNPNKQEYMTLRLELFEIVQSHMVPNTVVTSYMTRSMENANALWLLRKQFTTQMAAVTFMSYVMSSITRTPLRYLISRSTGQIYMSDFVPGYHPQQSPLTLHPGEAVPFRFTPSLQRFVGPIGVEGIMTAGIMAIGRALTEPEFDLEQHLGLFIRDEVVLWHLYNNKPIGNDLTLKQIVNQIVESISKKAEILSCRMERETAIAAPANQSVSTNAVNNVQVLLQQAVNPQYLSRMAEQWLPWL